nr:hypothetical transcript [Hymenolepis microstoma]
MMAQNIPIRTSRSMYPENSISMKKAKNDEIIIPITKFPLLDIHTYRTTNISSIASVRDGSDKNTYIAVNFVSVGLSMECTKCLSMIFEKAKRFKVKFGSLET